MSLKQIEVAEQDNKTHNTHLNEEIQEIEQRISNPPDGGLDTAFIEQASITQDVTVDMEASQFADGLISKELKEDDRPIDQERLQNTESRDDGARIIQEEVNRRGQFELVQPVVRTEATNQGSQYYQTVNEQVVDPYNYNVTVPLSRTIVAPVQQRILVPVERTIVTNVVQTIITPISKTVMTQVPEIVIDHVQKIVDVNGTPTTVIVPVERTVFRSIPVTVMENVEETVIVPIIQKIIVPVEQTIINNATQTLVAPITQNLY